MLNFKTEMIYLVHNGNGKIKIGYTGTERTLESRMRAYKTHNPDTVFLDVNEFSNIDDEHNIKTELKQYAIGRSEWYYDIPEVHEIWGRYKKLAETRVKEQLQNNEVKIVKQ